jgi:hypothetical protein
VVCLYVFTARKKGKRGERKIREMNIYGLLAVAGAPVKPAMDEDGMVMIQLHKSSGKNADNPNNVFVVELVYIEVEVLSPFLFLFFFFFLICI